jgi:membrane fusion protein, multidrug efflux system
MNTIKNLSCVVLLALLAACGGSKKDDNATINDLKAKIEKQKADKAKADADLKKLEADLIRMDSASATLAKIKLVAVIPVVTQPFEHFIDLIGRVDADNISYITPRLGPGQVKQIYITEGQLIKKGQLVLKLDDAIVRQQITAAKKTMDGVKTQLSYARNVYQRQKNLWEQGIGTEVQLLTLKTSVESLENQLVAADEQVKILVEQLKTANVYSDVTGVVDQLNVRVGETFVGATAMGPQIRVVNKSSLKVVANIPENYSLRVQRGTPVVINIPDANTTVNSSINLISQSVEANMRGFMAEAKIPSNTALRPNQSANMRVKDYSVANAIVIPSSMVQADEVGKYVYVATKASNGKTYAHKVVVVVGETYGSNVEIKGGLQAGAEGQLISVVK